MLKLSSFHIGDKFVAKDVMTKAKLTLCTNDTTLMNLIVSSENYDMVVSITTDLVNRRMEEGVLPSSKKQVFMKPIVKENLDPHSVRLMSNATFQS